ncbi:hypothetical protein CORC01_08983 [Colletotrichum orchidophilum]|uniref:Uncharacterized protein n=1 Tax=Colletotrichum orchidophilum TaxID=1209926 RepID=A0A1G4B2P9_9PEZI|nr:uncharacterized protein CORC01_08983 [Colletotrichum orchidophilum]OHE95699.1 hypothetical protein CORC01_08983 [Colletotrichum orchidophilum]
MMYKIKRVLSTLRLKGLWVGNGGKCSGTFVDRNLYEFLAKRFGTAFASLPFTQTGTGVESADQIEDRKRDFIVQRVSKRPMKLGLRMEGLGAMSKLADYYEAQSKVLLARQDKANSF